MSKDLEAKVLEAAEKWFRATLLLEKLLPHEKELFQAMAELRKSQKRGSLSSISIQIPRAPRVPEIVLPEEEPLRRHPPTLRDMPAFPVDPRPISQEMLVPHDILTISTKPLPPDEQEELIEKMLADAYESAIK